MFFGFTQITGKWFSYARTIDNQLSVFSGKLENKIRDGLGFVYLNGAYSKPTQFHCFARINF
jgi:hypothetical protein